MDELFDNPEKREPKIPAAEHLRYHKTIGLAVSGDVKLTKLETDIIDTPGFQRLRWIQQLGSCSWIYPTAVHTRFDHSLGVLKMTDNMIAAINEGMAQVDPKPGISPPRFGVTDQQRILARLYALLHDITHVPFGHTLEDELKIFGSHDKLTGEDSSEGKSKFESLVGEGSTIGNMIGDVLGDAMYKRLIDIILLGKTKRLEVMDEDGPRCDEFVYHLVSDTVCSDLLDYVERDSHFCNLGLSIHKRFMDYIYVSDVSLEGEQRRRVVVRLWKPRKGMPRFDVMTDLASLLDARYKLTERVYFHHSKITTAAMIGRAAQEALYCGLLSAMQMLEFGDATFLDYLANIDTRTPFSRRKPFLDSVNAITKLARAVLRRELYVRLKPYSKSNFDGDADEGCYDGLITDFASANRRREVENALAKLARAKPGDVLVYVASPSMNKKIAQAWVDYGNRRTLLSEVPEPTLKARIENIKDSHVRLWNAELLVHRDLTLAQRDLVRWGFESQYFPARLAESAFLNLLTEVAAQDEKVGQLGQLTIRDACRSAAVELAAGERVLGHGREMWSLLQETLRTKLGLSR